MARLEPQNDYGTFGSVPEVESQGTLTVHASPDAFGGAIAGAMEQGGKQAEGLGSAIDETAIKLQGMVNETMATDAESQYLAARGKLDGDFKSLSGQAAYAALPKYVNDIQNLRKQYRPGGADAIGGAARAYDLTTIRAEGYSINDANMWAAQQVKVANRDSALRGISAQQMVAGQPGAAADDQQFDETLGHITHFTQATLHEGDPGVVSDGKGGFKFGDDDAGQTAQRGYQAALDSNIGQAWQNRISTLAMQDPVAAANKYMENRQRIPAAAQASIESNLRPALLNAFAHGGVQQVLSQAFGDHQEFTSTPQSVSVADAIHGQESRGRANSPTSVDNAMGGWQITPATWNTWQGEGLVKPGEVITNPKDNETVARRAIAKYSDDYKNADGTPDAARVAVAYFSGPGNVAPPGNATPYLVNKHDGNGKYVNSYVSDVLGRMGQKSQSVPGLPASNYPKNGNGSPITLPDYYASHRDEILANGDDYAEKAMPGDIEFRNQVRERLTNQMNAAISSQSAAYKQDNQQIMQGISGQLTNGKPPATYQELYAIPGMADILNRSAVHSPEFTRNIDKMITRYSRQGKDEIDYGAKWDEVKDAIADHKINSVADLAPYIHDNTLSAKGVDQAMKWMNDFEKKPVETETKKLAFQTLKNIVWPNNKFDVTGEGLPNWTRAQAFAEPAWDQVQKDVADNKYTLDDALNRDSPHWWGKMLPPQFIPSPAAANAAMLKSAAQSSTVNSRTLQTALLEYESEKDPMKKQLLVQEMIKNGWISRDDTQEIPQAPVTK